MPASLVDYQPNVATVWQASATHIDQDNATGWADSFSFVNPTTTMDAGVVYTQGSPD